MALQKTPLNIGFSQGLDTRTDPKQVQLGKFLELKNSVFTKVGLLKKRNGFGRLPSLPDDSSVFSTTFNGNLTTIGASLEALSSGSQTWVNKGYIQPALLDTLPLLRSNTNQSQVDSAVSSSGLICTVFTDNVPVAGVVTAQYKYVIADVTTGQNIIAPTVLTVSSGTITGSPKVFLLGRYFIIVISNNISGTYHLQYKYINVSSPTAISAEVNISSLYTPATTVAWDGYVANNSLYLAWNGSDGGGAIRMTYIDSSLTQHNTVTFSSRVATMMSVTADLSGTTPIIYASFYDDSSNDGYALAVAPDLTTIHAPSKIINNLDVLNITSTAINGVVTAFYETNNAYTYDSATKTNYVSRVTCTQAGVVGSPAVVARSIGLASKAFIVDGVSYFLSVFSSNYQPSYFLVNGSGGVVAKLAYSNASGYYTLGLPNVSLTDNVAQFPYFFRDMIVPVNKDQGATISVGSYSQLGINLATVTIGTSDISTAEIGSNLNLSGGILWSYDGYVPVEQGFHLWPDNTGLTEANGGGHLTDQTYFYVALYEWSDNQGNIFRSAPSVPDSIAVAVKANKTFASTDVNTSTERITVTAHGYNTGTQFTLTTSGSLPTPFVVATDYYAIVIDANTIQVATTFANALAGTPINITNAGSGTNTIHTVASSSSVLVNIPTLRLTYKTANPVKIVVFRASTAQPTYYQVTSISNPTLNDTTVDSVRFIDTVADTGIVGNSILYTAGGVVENIGPPGASSLTLYKSRLMLVDAEDKNLIWYSKQVIEATPVEMSDLFTLYIAPTTSAQGSTGPIKALSAMDDKLIIFKKDAIYYVTGTGPDNTGANNDFSDPVFITSTVGCSNQRSIVFTPEGLMFQSSKGIWLLGRDLSTKYIGADVQDFNQYTVLSAINVPATNQVRFTLSNGTMLMYDYFYNQWGTFSNVGNVSSTVYEELHTFINSRGEVYQETPGVYLDGSSPVLMSFKTSWINTAGIQGFQRAYWLFLIGEYISPHELGIGVAYDYGPGPEQLTTVSPINYNGPYGTGSFYGDGEDYGGNPSLEQWQVFFARQKCQAFQIQLSESFDGSLGVAAGAGFTLSALTLVVGVKDGTPKLRAIQSVG